MTAMDRLRTANDTVQARTERELARLYLMQAYLVVAGIWDVEVDYILKDSSKAAERLRSITTYVLVTALQLNSRTVADVLGLHKSGITKRKNSVLQWRDEDLDLDAKLDDACDQLVRLDQVFAAA